MVRESTRLERALVGSFVEAEIDEEKEAGFSAWSMTLEAWVSLMTGLPGNQHGLDHCPDKQPVERWSNRLGRIRDTDTECCLPLWSTHCEVSLLWHRAP
ncbi:hypothetical protein GX51_07585 [Blastomyces parvus]|uniref:Uncharacterized protein n=1 Tax=Blastomyces parvus TaxID=2060905 RepID=A0A2B7WKA2_9EURO|nr:hypothetical protein GX51_07585 [Blastomyces parvus]